jgi:hypothetical protein
MKKEEFTTNNTNRTNKISHKDTKTQRFYFNYLFLSAFAPLCEILSLFVRVRGKFFSCEERLCC